MTPLYQEMWESTKTEALQSLFSQHLMPFVKIQNKANKQTKQRKNCQDRLGFISVVCMGNVLLKKKQVWTEDIDLWSFLFLFLFKQLLSDILGDCKMGQTPKRHITAVFESTAWKIDLTEEGSRLKKKKKKKKRAFHPISPQDWVKRVAAKREAQSRDSCKARFKRQLSDLPFISN